MKYWFFICATFMSLACKGQLVALGMSEAEIIKDNYSIKFLKESPDIKRGDNYTLLKYKDYEYNSIWQYYIEAKQKICTIQTLIYPVKYMPSIITNLNTKFDNLGDDRWISKDRLFKVKIKIEELSDGKFIIISYRLLADPID